MVKMIDSMKFYIPEECKCKLNIVSNILDHLTVKNNLSVRQKEELLTDLHKAFWEELAHFSNGAYLDWSSWLNKYGYQFSLLY